MKKGPVARAESVTGAGDERLERLVRNGVVHRARAGGAKKVLAGTPPRAKQEASALQALLAERRHAR